MTNAPTTKRQRTLHVQARSQAAVEARPRRDLNDLLNAANGVAVSPHPGYYPVTINSGSKARHHFATKERRCLCALGAECPAVLEVAKHLKAGGERAPAACPICDGAVHFSPALTRKTSNLGWMCAESAREEMPGALTYVSGQCHFIQWQWMGLKAWDTHNRQEAAHATGASA